MALSLGFEFGLAVGQGGDLAGLTDACQAGITEAETAGGSQIPLQTIGELAEHQKSLRRPLLPQGGRFGEYPNREQRRIVARRRGHGMAPVGRAKTEPEGSKRY